jgi:ABC-type phosphate/phosphonate transport system substrate-binding protein
MKQIIKNLILQLLLVPLLICQEQKENKPELIEPIKLIISLNSFHNAKVEDAQAIAQILANHIKKAHNLKNEFEVKTPDNLDEIEKSANDGFDLIIVTTEEYLHLQKKLPLEPFVTNNTMGHIGYKYHLIVNKNENIKDISQLKGETLYMLSRKNQKAALLWLENILNDKGLPNSKLFFKSLIQDYKASNEVLPVLFNKAKACIVTEISLDLLSELNPALKEKVTILQSSEYILLGLGCLNKNKKDTEIFKILKDIVPKLHTNEYGKQLINLFNADQLVPYEEEYLQNYLKFNK